MSKQIDDGIFEDLPFRRRVRKAILNKPKPLFARVVPLEDDPDEVTLSNSDKGSVRKANPASMSPVPLTVVSPDSSPLQKAIRLRLHIDLG